mgnify:CR=1 FL=1
MNISQSASFFHMELVYLYRKYTQLKTGLVRTSFKCTCLLFIPLIFGYDESAIYTIIIILKCLCENRIYRGANA